MKLKEKFDTEMTRQLNAGVRQVDVSFTHRGRVYREPYWSIHKGAYLVYSSPVGNPSKTVLRYV